MILGQALKDFMSQSFSSIIWIIFQVGVVEGGFRSRPELCVLVVTDQSEMAFLAFFIAVQSVLWEYQHVLT